MTAWCAIKVRVDCPECGSAVLLEGPYEEFGCASCGAEGIALGHGWPNIVQQAFEHAGREGEFHLFNILDSDAPSPFLYVAALRDVPPICNRCDRRMEEAAQTPAGTDGQLECTGCKATHRTWPAPDYLNDLDLVDYCEEGYFEPEQLFMAPPGELAPAATKPVAMECMRCGAGLEITGADRRLVTCKYCEADLYLPAAVWNRLHPARKRTSFWLRGKHHGTKKGRGRLP